MRLSRVEAIEIEPAVVRLTVEVPPEEVQSAMRHLFNRLRRLIHVRGFRPGRAPIAIIRRQVGDENIRARLLEEIIPKAYAEALEKEQLQPLMLQRIQLKHFEEGDRLEFEAEVAIRKPVELGDYRNIRIQPPSTEVTDEDIERALDELREQYPTYEPDPEHVAVRGDRVLIRYTITPILSDESAQASAHANGEVVEGETDAERDIRTTYVTAGEGHWFPPFNNYVLGKRAGDEAEHELTFPDDFPNEQLRGRRCKV
ncbi:MAG TPA: hypothetical protein EYP10_11455, partial [Armatimonadetes bacterium]|nr:hypothetical protein [Armatimonadota bacterium]